MTEREKMQLFAKSETVAELMRFRFPRYAELPKLDLYMDQVLSVVSETLSVFQTEKKEKVLTAAMVNNYVKQKVLPPPVRKRYQTSHLAYLLCLTVFKQVLSIGEISQLIAYQQDHYEVGIAYDRFCEEVETAVRKIFGGEGAGPAPEGPGEMRVLRGAVLSFINKIFVQKYLQFLKEELSGQSGESKEG